MTCALNVLPPADLKIESKEISGWNIRRRFKKSQKLGKAKHLTWEKTSQKNRQSKHISLSYSNLYKTRFIQLSFQVVNFPSGRYHKTFSGSVVQFEVRKFLKSDPVLFLPVNVQGPFWILESINQSINRSIDQSQCCRSLPNHLLAREGRHGPVWSCRWPINGTSHVSL